MSTVGAILVGAGRGERMGGTDKIFALLHQRPVLTYSLDAFQASPAIQAIVVVLSQHNLQAGRELIASGPWSKVIAVVPGGDRRQDSTLAGLQALPPSDLVAVHDAARPLLTTALIARGVATLEAPHLSGAIAAMPVKETIKIVDAGGIVQQTPPREQLWAAQTPQFARYQQLRTALETLTASSQTVTDEAAALEAAGQQVAVFRGSYRNLKITTPEDLQLAATLLQTEDEQ